MRILISILCVFFIACGSDTGSTNSNKELASTPSTSNLESPEVKIHVNGMSPGMAQLIGTFGDQQFRMDTATINQNGDLIFKRAEPYTPGFYIVLFPDQSQLQLLIDTHQKFSVESQAGRFVQMTQVTGNPDSEMLYENLRFQESQRAHIREVSAQIKKATPDTPEFNELKAKQDLYLQKRKEHLEELYARNPKSLFAAFKKAGQNPDIQDVRKPDGSLDPVKQLYLYRRSFWDSVDFSDVRLMSTPVIHNKLKRYIVELTSQSVADSIVASAVYLTDKVLDYPEYFKFFSNWVVLNYDAEKTTLMDPEAVFANMAQRYFTYERAFWSDSTQIYAIQQRAHEMTASLVGKVAPDVSAKDPNGQTKSIYGLKAPYKIVYIYNPTCEHCQEQTPKLVQFYREWKNKGVEVFGIGLDTNDQEWKGYINKVGMNWTNVYDPTNRALYAKYYVNKTPEIYVIGPDNKIIAKNLKVFQIAEVINRDKAKRG
jgi:peroxiredoxin